jgi:hypothetical protein
MNDQERIFVPHHEAGHVLAAWAVHGVERFVRKNFPAIHEVAMALAERGVLTGDELASMLPAELRDSLYQPKPRRTSKRQTELFP